MVIFSGHLENEYWSSVPDDKDWELVENSDTNDNHIMDQVADEDIGHLGPEPGNECDYEPIGNLYDDDTDTYPDVERYLNMDNDNQVGYYGFNTAHEYARSKENEPYVSEFSAYKRMKRKEELELRKAMEQSLEEKNNWIKEHSNPGGVDMDNKDINTNMDFVVQSAAPDWYAEMMAARHINIDELFTENELKPLLFAPVANPNENRRKNNLDVVASLDPNNLPQEVLNMLVVAPPVEEAVEEPIILNHEPMEIDNPPPAYESTDIYDVGMNAINNIINSDAQILQDEQIAKRLANQLSEDNATEKTQIYSGYRGMGQNGAIWGSDGKLAVSSMKNTQFNENCAYYNSQSQYCGTDRIKY